MAIRYALPRPQSTRRVVALVMRAENLQWLDQEHGTGTAQATEGECPYHYLRLAARKAAENRAAL